jgi:hypothetical protein
VNFDITCLLAAIFRGPAGNGLATAGHCTGATGQHALAVCPNFGRIDNGTFTPLAHNSGDCIVAW